MTSIRTGQETRMTTQMTAMSQKMSNNHVVNKQPKSFVMRKTLELIEKRNQ